MADKAPEQEPSIEEILASIRQIISDDDKEPQDEPVPEVVAAPPVAPPAPEPKPEPKPAPTPEPVKAVEPEPEPEPEEDILELTEPLMEEEDPIEVDLQDIEEEFTPPPAPPASPAPTPEPSPVMQQASDSNMLNDRARKSAISSMAKLAGNMPINRADHGLSSITLEDLVREMLNPMLSDWLNSNLPPMVERIVQKELEKLARQAMDV